MSVSLSQINAFTADPEKGSGMPATVIDNSRAINNILNAANQKAQYDWAKYQQFLKNQEGFYSNLQDLSKLEIATQDRDAIASGYKDIIKQAMEHPEIFHGRNQNLYGQLQAASGELMQKATESKVNRLYDLSHRAYIAQNPSLNTLENIQKIDDYFKQPLGQRKNYTLSLPGLFDPNELAKTINAQIEQPYSSVSTIGGVEGAPGGAQKFLPGEQYLYEESGKQYDPNKFMQLAAQSYDLSDKRGIQLRSEVERRFTQLPTELQNQYQNDPKRWYLDLMQARISPKAVDKSNIQANPNYLKAEELRFKWANYGLEREKLNKTKAEDIVGADSVINEALAIYDKGITREIYGEPGIKELKTINEPTLLQSFAHIDKDGRTINQPDEVEADPKTGQLYLVYFDKDKTTGLPKYSPGGKRLIKERKGMDERTWLKMIAKRSFPNKDIGAINTIVENVIQKAGGNLDKLNQLKNPSSSANAPTPTNYKNRAKMADGSIIYTNDGKTWYDAKGKLIE